LSGRETFEESYWYFPVKQSEALFEATALGVHRPLFCSLLQWTPGSGQAQKSPKKIVFAVDLSTLNN